jgi:NSS family neurotransmitter:Na+ symporter
VTLLLEAVLMLPSALHPPLIEKLDLVFGSGMQVLGSVLAVVGLVWGLGRAVTIGQIYGQARAGDSRPRLWERACFWWLRWVVPGALVAILVSYIHSKIR